MRHQVTERLLAFRRWRSRAGTVMTHLQTTTTEDELRQRIVRLRQVLDNLLFACERADPQPIFPEQMEAARQALKDQTP